MGIVQCIANTLHIHDNLLKRHPCPRRVRLQQRGGQHIERQKGQAAGDIAIKDTHQAWMREGDQAQSLVLKALNPGAGQRQTNNFECGGGPGTYVRARG